MHGRSKRPVPSTEHDTSTTTVRQIIRASQEAVAVISRQRSQLTLTLTLTLTLMSWSAPQHQPPAWITVPPTHHQRSLSPHLHTQTRNRAATQQRRRRRRPVDAITAAGPQQHTRPSARAGRRAITVRRGAACRARAGLCAAGVSATRLGWGRD